MKFNIYISIKAVSTDSTKANDGTVHRISPVYLEKHCLKLRWNGHQSELSHNTTSYGLLSL